MILSQQDKRIIARNEREIKEYFEFMADMQRKIDLLKKQNRELKGVDHVRGTNSQDSKRSAS
jgi:hypothetical protein